MHINQGEHWTLVGMTGSGKTYFEVRLLQTMMRAWPNTPVFIVDAKRQDDFAIWNRFYYEHDTLPSRLPQFMVWRPSIDDPAMYDKAFGQILQEGTKRTVLVDELSLIGGRDGQSYPLNFQRLMKVGRGMHITMVVGTQELANGPRQIIGQCQHGVLFRIQNWYDLRKFWKDLAGQDGIDMRAMAPHGFWYYNSKQHEKRLFADVRELVH